MNTISSVGCNRRATFPEVNSRSRSGQKKRGGCVGILNNKAFDPGARFDLFFGSSRMFLA